MSADIFTTLAARTLGRTEGLVPVMPSRFEPAAEADISDPSGFETAAAAPFEVERKPAPAVDAPEPRLGQPDAVDHPRASVAKDTVRLVVEPPRETLTSQAGKPPTTAPVLSAVNERETAVDRAESPPVRIGSILETQPLVDPRLRRPETSQTPGGLRPSEQQKPVVPSPTSADRRAGSPEARSEPPTVIVRIGRVDIHAATKPGAMPAPAAPVRAVSRPSLADHLRARAEGRR